MICCKIYDDEREYTAEIYFYRTRSGMELDVLIQTEAGLTGIEIKFRKTHAKADL